MSDDNKPKLGTRAPLGLNKAVAVGQVKQTFSHGRSKQVVVEVKRARVLHRPGDAAPEPTPAPAPAPAAVTPAPAPRPAAPAPAPVAAAPAAAAEPAPVPSAPRPPTPPPVMFRPVERAPLPPKPETKAPEPTVPAPETKVEPAPVPQTKAAAPPAPAARPAAGAARPAQPARPAQGQAAAPQRPRMTPAEMAALYARQAEEDRQRLLEEVRIREDQERAAREEEERRRIEEKRHREEELATRPDPQPDADGGMVIPTDVSDDDDDSMRVRIIPGRKPEAAKPSRPKLGDDRRKAGKLTVTRALDDEGNTRVRSLAALRRAREKERGRLGSQAKQVRDVTVPDMITVQELANRMAERTGNVVRLLARLGVPSAAVDEIDQDTAELVLTEFGHNIVRVSESDVEKGMVGEVDVDKDLAFRPPVVTIMGHVDHGKTSLLDSLRGTNVVKGEAGGITQHIGAYQVTTKDKNKITFLDTPGHEAFTSMRARGASITDIVVLVVAWDDGIMPQTIEAIQHTKAAGVPMIVAINKMDKPGADAARIRTALLQQDVQVEEMGGDVMDVEISAIKKTGLDDLLEKILLLAEVSELKANPDRPAEGTVIEAKLDKGKGPLATVLVRRGTLKRGDIFVMGQEWGRVRAMVDDKGETVKEAGPSTAVEVLGLGGVPQAGDVVTVVENEARAREVAEYRAGVATAARTAGNGPANLEDMFSVLRAKKVQEFPLVIKADTQGSAEAIAGAVSKVGNDLIRAKVLLASTGGITESDVTLAKASGAPVIGFNVRANAKAREIAQRDGVALKYYDVIYDLIDDVKAGMAGQLGPEAFETVVGRAQVLDVFQAGKIGKAAGLRVTEGYIKKALRARVMRDDVIIYTGSIASLRRFKEDVAEVKVGLECGITLADSSDVKAGDIVETYEVEMKERNL
jgi:translation initiation factor IF-2